MPERTSYDHGTPSWVDLSTTDPTAAKSFYGALFGWTAEDVPTPNGTYTLLRSNGKLVAALMDQPQAQRDMGAPPNWATYITVDNIEAATAKAAAAGGTVHMPPMDVMGSGKMSVVQDSTGAYFAMWQAGSHFGAELVSEPGALIWNELVTSDPAAAQKFYVDMFGWGTDTQEMPTGPYTMFTAGEDFRGGLMQMPDEMAGAPNHWQVYFAVADMDAAVGAVGQGGGTVLMPPFDVPGVGKMAAIQDPQGAAFTIMEPAPQT